MSRSRIIAQPVHRLAFLDALRGVAALFVTVYHLVMIPDPHLNLPGIAGLVAGNGGSGVALFFVVSAFSLCLTMPAHLESQAPLTRFYLYRFFRIAPLFYLVLALTILRDWSVFGAIHSIPGVLASVLFLFNFFPGHQEGIAWASWTIGVEMVFYVLFPLLYRFADDLPKAVALFFATLLLWRLADAAILALPIAPAVRPMFAHISIAHQLPVFALGVCAFHAYRRFAGNQRAARWGSAAALVLASLYGLMLSFNGRLVDPLGLDAWTWQAVLYAVLLLGVSLMPAALLAGRIAQFYGRISYSLYLIHANVILFSAPLYRHVYAAVALPELAFTLCLVLTLVIATPLAWLAYRWVELPGIEMGRQVFRRLTRAQVPA